MRAEAWGLLFAGGALLTPGAASAGELLLKVHDMGGVAQGVLEVTLSGEGGSAKVVPRDDGVPPDALAGDHLWTGAVTGQAPAHGEVRVTAGARAWTGGYALQGDFLLVGLEPSGFAAASTRDLALGPPGGAASSGGLGSAPPAGGAPPMGTLPSGSPPPGAGGTAPHGGPPEGTWIGLGGLLLAIGGLGWLARGRWAAPGAPLPVLRGPWSPAEGGPLTVHVGAPAALPVTAELRLGPADPESLARGALEALAAAWGRGERGGGPPRVALHVAVDAEALARALGGLAQVWVVTPSAGGADYSTVSSGQ